MIRKVLITGATQGIGLAISQLLANKGWQVMGIARNQYRNFPGKLFLCDLSSREETEKLLKKLSGLSIDAIVNNVGIALPEKIEDILLENLDSVYDLNVRVAIQVTQALVKHMKIQSYGRIVNIASRAIFGSKSRTSYSAAKAASVGVTKTWALELAMNGITVNAVAPGPIETALFRKTRPVGSEEERSVLDTIPMRRIGKPSEIASGVAFLLSEEAAFITGQVLCIDGGGSL